MKIKDSLHLPHTTIQMIATLNIFSEISISHFQSFTLKARPYNWKFRTHSSDIQCYACVCVYSRFSSNRVLWVYLSMNAKCISLSSHIIEQIYVLLTCGTCEICIAPINRNIKNGKRTEETKKSKRENERKWMSELENNE